MEATVFRSKDHVMLDKIVGKHWVGMPFLDENGDRVGTVVRMWRDGDRVRADIEVVPEDVVKWKKKGRG